MSLLVVGSIALDTVETPDAKAEDVFGGSAAYFSYAASFFTDVRLVGVVGEDFPDKHLDMLKDRGIDTAGLEQVEGPTFRWHGKYMEDKNIRETVCVELNCLETFDPKVPDEYKDTPFVFLANANPSIQLKTLEQMTETELVVADTMNLWIENEREALEELLRKVDGFVMNDEEVRMFTGKHNLVVGGREIMEFGLKFLVVKKGEHGALLFTVQGVTPFPAHPLDCEVDPTGAGDSFGGGFMGRLAETGDTSELGLKRALVYGSVTAAFTCEDFSLGRLKTLAREDIDQRYGDYVGALHIGE